MPDRERAEEQAEKVSRIIETGVYAVRGLLALGQALPVIGSVLCVAEEILAKVQDLKDRNDDINRAGELVVDVLELLGLMGDNMHQLSTGRDAVEQRMQSLLERLKSVHDAVVDLGKEGWFKRLCKLMIDEKSLSNIDREVREDLRTLMDFYKVARDAKVTEMLAQHTYTAEVAIDEQAQRRVREAGGSTNEALVWVQSNDEALKALSEQIGVGIDELKEGIGAIREKLEAMHTSVQKLVAGLQDGNKQYQYDPFKPGDKHQWDAILGRGSFGVTYRMVSLYDKHQYAVKIISVRSAEVSLEKLSKEATMLRQLDHPRIVRYFNSCTFEGGHEFAIVMELLTGGTFGNGVRLGATSDRVKVWVGEVASGLACMHAHSILHRDLKPDNVMFDAAGRTRIIDLGLACTLASKSRLTTRRGSSLYMSPEKAMGQSYNEKDDIWALGCMLAGGLMGKLLEDMSDINSRGLVCLDRAKMDSLVKQAGEGDKSVDTLVALMLGQTPMERPTAKQVEQALSHTGHAVAGEAVASTSSALALGGAAVLSSIADPVVVQGIPVQPTPAVVSGAASRLAGMEPLLPEQDVSTFLPKVGCDLSALRDKTSIEWKSKRINDHDCRVIAHLALPASSQSPSMGVLGKLAQFSLQWNEIGEKGAQHIGEALKINTVLTTLDLKYNSIGDEGAEHIGEALKLNKTLTSLNLENNLIGAEGARFIGEGLKDNEAFTSLNLTYNQILAEGAKHIGEALKINKTLTSLDLQYNQIGADGARFIGEGLKFNEALTSLNLEGNLIGDYGAQCMSDALKENMALTSLKIDGHALPIMELKGVSPVQDIDLREKGIGIASCIILAACIASNQVLKRLNLRSNSIGAEGTKHIATALKINRTISSLNLYNNNIGDEGAQHIGEALKTYNGTLTSLDLYVNQIGASGALHIGEALKENKALASLNIGGNRIGVKGIQHLGEALEKNVTLTFLKLRSNDIGAEGAKHIGKALKDNNTLTFLDLDGHALPILELKGDSPVETIELQGKGLTHLSGIVIASCVSSNSVLTSLNLWKNEIGAEGAKHIGKALKKNTVLTSLDLSDNAIGDEGAQHISETLKINEALTSLDLRANSIGPEGAKHISEGLKMNEVLSTLNLGENSIGDRGAQHIGEGLKIIKALTKLNLYDSSIGPEGAKHIGEGLKINKVLSTLNLGKNSIGDRGAQHIGEGLKKNRALTKLSLYDISIGPEGAKKIGEGFKMNEVLSTLNLMGNGIGAEGAKHIGEALKINKALTELNIEENKLDNAAKTALKAVVRKEVDLQM